MKYNELVKEIEEGKYDEYLDRPDASIEISLCEYGFLRNPSTDHCIFCANTMCEFTEDNKEMDIHTTYISFQDVLEALEEADRGYYSFIGSDKQTEVSYLSNSNLSNTITSMNCWNGKFIPYY